LDGVHEGANGAEIKAGLGPDTNIAQPPVTGGTRVYPLLADRKSGREAEGECNVPSPIQTQKIRWVFAAFRNPIKGYIPPKA